MDKLAKLQQRYDDARRQLAASYKACADNDALAVAYRTKETARKALYRARSGPARPQLTVAQAVAIRDAAAHWLTAVETTGIAEIIADARRALVNATQRVNRCRRLGRY